MDGLYGELGLRQMVPPLYPGLFEGSADDALDALVHGGLVGAVPKRSVGQGHFRTSSWNNSPLHLLNMGLFMGRSRFKWNTLRGVFIYE